MGCSSSKLNEVDSTLYTKNNCTNNINDQLIENRAMVAPQKSYAYPLPLHSKIIHDDKNDEKYKIQDPYNLRRNYSSKDNLLDNTETTEDDKMYSIEHNKLDINNVPISVFNCNESNPTATTATSTSIKSLNTKDNQSNIFVKHVKVNRSCSLYTNRLCNSADSIDLNSSKSNKKNITIYENIKNKKMERRQSCPILNSIYNINNSI